MLAVLLLSPDLDLCLDLAPDRLSPDLRLDLDRLSLRLDLDLGRHLPERKRDLFLRNSLSSLSFSFSLSFSLSRFRLFLTATAARLISCSSL